MDRNTIEQLDRIEEKIEIIMQNELEESQIDTINGFYEKEVLDNNGRLRHLKDDKIFADFIEKLNMEMEEEEGEIGEEEYRTEKLR